MNADAYASAAYWARELLGSNALYCDLQPGDRFRFKPGGTLYAARTRGWYVRADGTGRSYRTGTHTGVIRET